MCCSILILVAEQVLALFGPNSLTSAEIRVQKEGDWAFPSTTPKLRNAQPPELCDMEDPTLFIADLMNPLVRLGFNTR